MQVNIQVQQNDLECKYTKRTSNHSTVFWVFPEILRTWMKPSVDGKQRRMSLLAQLSPARPATKSRWSSPVSSCHSFYTTPRQKFIKTFDYIISYGDQHLLQLNFYITLLSCINCLGVQTLTVKLYSNLPDKPTTARGAHHPPEHHAASWMFLPSSTGYLASRKCNPMQL